MNKYDEAIALLRREAEAKIEMGLSLLRQRKFEGAHGWVTLGDDLRSAADDLERLQNES